MRGVADPGPTARFATLPQRHDGESAFDIELQFSAAPDALSYRMVAGGLLAVTGGAVESARRKIRHSNIAWVVTIHPERTRRHSDPAAGPGLRRGERGLCRQPPAGGGRDGGGAGRFVHGLVRRGAGGA